MSICDSEENRKKLAWLVPGYILLAWFFCVLFQPLGIHNSGQASNIKNLLQSQDQLHYRQFYFIKDDVHDDVDDHEVENKVVNLKESCPLNGTTIVLEKGSQSAVIIRLGHLNYQPSLAFSCTVRIEAGKGLDGLTAVVEDMDLRETTDDRQHHALSEPWGQSGCVDYVETYTDKSKVRNKLCGQWNVMNDDRLNSHGPHQTLVGYCYDDRSGHSCESKTIFINVVLDGSQTNYGLNIRGRRGFTIVVTGYRHLKPNESECDQEEEFQCPIHDFSLHDQRPHCIWKDLKCDSHQNCGFTFNKDESECLFIGSNNASIWTISTMTVLVVVYLGIVLLLVMATILLLKWHKDLRTPLDVLADSRMDMSSTEHGDGSLTTETRTGTVSIIVSYRPHFRGAPKATEVQAPPSYDSIFLNDSPPNYETSVEENPEEIGTEDHGDRRFGDRGNSGQRQNSNYSFRSDHCDCDCDHSVPN